MIMMMMMCLYSGGRKAVSYTHLDVYKRQSSEKPRQEVDEYKMTPSLQNKFSITHNNELYYFTSQITKLTL